MPHLQEKYQELEFMILSCNIPVVLDNMMVQGSTVEHN